MTLETLRDGDPGQVGQYTLLGRLGEGGMGVVYLGRDPEGTRVAVKLIHARMDADAGFRRRFAREVAAAKRVARFCTAPVLDADVQGEMAYLVTEYVEGPSLGAAVRESGPLKGSALDGLAASMAMALRAIHGAGVVHRDLKPSNVLLSQVGPKVIDFGIAHLTGSDMSSTIVGTPSYMSPEHVSGGEVGPASDIFAWGCTVAFAASGVPPFGTGSVPAVLLRIVNHPPDVRGLSGSLRDLVLAALAKDPAARPTAQELMDHLSTSTPPTVVPDASSPTGVSAHAGRADAAPADEGTRPAGRRGKLLAAAAALVVAVAGGSAVLAWRGQSSPSEAGTPATGAATGNPLRARDNVPFYAPPEPGASRQAGLWADDRPADAELMRKLAAVPHAIRLGQPEVQSKVDATIRAARRAGGVPVFLVNYMPGSGCLPVGAADMAAYQEWIKGIAGRIGDAPAVVILEPGSLVKIPGSKDCAMRGSPAQRYQGLREAVQTLKANPGTAVYLDGSQDFWPGTEIMAERLIGAGVDRADGFFVNTAGYQRTENSVEYARKLSACVGVRLATGRKGCPAEVSADPARMPHFVVDTSRNGQGSWAPTRKYPDPQAWCNPPGRGVGDRPTTVTGEELADAYLWIARPGVSSGRCPRGTAGQKDPERGVVSPQAGQWWAELALERVKNANPPLR
ncbi:glycoside hydrolase family 6 protein [Nonomuraea sp. K274]|uniref:Glycoside hydrolase family 6 protein n=1 Tax=Nonomuraea cypriaca TaxID=1187855 RepID=A0A931EZJ7_9ACTN|nr:glycoside hydrolase family 6 protein [Nonomuraea cypriaca]MBF8188420.1 glycoside hydrolase family 6 protein [Nonomuraea cypriaca]